MWRARACGTRLRKNRGRPVSTDFNGTRSGGASAELLEFHFCFCSQEIGVEEQAGYAQGGELAAGEFADPGLLDTQDTFQIARAVLASFDQLQDFLVQRGFEF